MDRYFFTGCIALFLSLSFINCKQPPAAAEVEIMTLQMKHCLLQVNDKSYFLDTMTIGSKIDSINNKQIPLSNRFMQSGRVSICNVLLSRQINIRDVASMTIFISDTSGVKKKALIVQDQLSLAGKDSVIILREIH